MYEKHKCAFVWNIEKVFKKTHSVVQSVEHFYTEPAGEAGIAQTV